MNAKPIYQTVGDALSSSWKKGQKAARVMVYEISVCRRYMLLETFVECYNKGDNCQNGWKPHVYTAAIKNVYKKCGIEVVPEGESKVAQSPIPC